MIQPITVIIPTMNRPESLNRTLHYIADGIDLPCQIIIVDQSQTDETRKNNEKLLSAYNDVFKSIIYKYQQVPSSTIARNNGLLYATNEIIVFADDDIDVNTDTFANVANLMKDSSIAMIGGIDEYTQQSKTNIGYFLGTKSFIDRKIGHVTKSFLGRYPDCINSQIETHWAMGYFFVVRKHIIDKYNLRFDENLSSYAYAEDLDFTLNYYNCAKKESSKCILDPSVKVKHLATLEYRTPSSKSLYMYVINRKYLAHKHNFGFVGFLARNWCDFWRFVECVVGRKNASVFLKACLCKLRYAKDINSGKLDYNKFMK